MEAAFGSSTIAPMRLSAFSAPHGSPAVAKRTRRASNAVVTMAAGRAPLRRRLAVAASTAAAALALMQAPNPPVALASPPPARAVAAAVPRVKTASETKTAFQTPWHRRTALLAAAIISGSSSVVVAATIAVLVVIQDRFVYKPSAVSRGTPADFGFTDFWDADCKTSDGVHLRGWFLHAPTDSTASAPPSTNAPTVVYFHGRDKNASFRLKKAKALCDKVGCNVLLLSYRGFGESAPNRFPTEPGMCRDADAAMDYLARLAQSNKISSSRVWVYGESLGGGVAVHVAQKYGPERVVGLILENTFTSLLDMIDRTTPIFSPLKRLSRNRWTNADKVPTLAMPILFLSGLRDTFIPPVMMKRLYERAQASPYKELAEFPDGTHNRTWMMDGYFERVQDFIQAVTQNRSSRLTLPREQPSSA